MRAFFLFSLFVLVFSLSPAYANETTHPALNELRSFDLDRAPDGLKAVIGFSARPEFSKNNLTDPERFYLDFKNTVLAPGMGKSIEPAGGPVRKIRVYQHGPDKANLIGRAQERPWVGRAQERPWVRVVFEPAPGVSLLITRLAGPERLVLDFTGPPESPSADKLKEQALAVIINASLKTAAANTSDAQIEQKPLTEVSTPESPKAVVPPGLPSGGGLAHKWCIVIDPGHGGHDPGAMSRKGLKEKDVTLAIAMQVAGILGKDPRYEVHLTRSTDVYLTLDERTLIANRLNADLFLSIHVNSSPNKVNRGIETYFLNWTDDDEANRVAARENAITMKRMKEGRSELGYILASLELQGKRDDSLKLANYVQKSLTSAIEAKYPDVPGLGVKYALFYVLVGAKMPSALAEVSFLSHPKEEKYLRTEKYISEIASGIARGLELYLQDSSSSPAVARR